MKSRSDGTEAQDQKDQPEGNFRPKSYRCQEKGRQCDAHIGKDDDLFPIIAVDEGAGEHSQNCPRQVPGQGRQGDDCGGTGPLGEVPDNGHLQDRAGQHRSCLAEA